MEANKFDLKGFLNTPEAQANKPAAIQYLKSKGIVDDQGKPTASVAPPPTIAENFQAGGHAAISDVLGVEKNNSNAFIPSIVRSTIGSQGISGVVQNAVKSVAGKETLAQSTDLSQNAEGLYNQATDFLKKSQASTDPAQKAKYKQIANDLILHAKDLQGNADALAKDVPTQGENAGTTANALLTVGTFGSGSLASKAGLTGAKALGARAVENSAIGTGYQIASNLNEGAPITKDLGKAALASAIIPATIEGGGALKNKLLGEATPTAEHAINSLIKPLGKDFAYGKNPARGILNEGIVANTFDDLSQKVSGKISEVGGNIGALGQKLDQSGQISLNLTPALAPIDEAIQKAAKSNNTTLFNSLQNVKIALVHNLEVGADEKGTPAIVQGGAKNLLTAGYNEAKQFLSDIAEHTRFTGNPSDDKALNMATKQAYGITREIMNKGADSVSAADGAAMRDLNSRYGDLLSAKNAINHRDIVLQRQNFLNLADKFAIPVSIGGAMMTGLATGNWAKAGEVLASELAGIAVTKGIGSTASITRMAQFLSKLAPEERAGILNSTPVIKNIWERVTGQTTPAEGAPKTKTLQTVEDWIKNPKLGASIMDVSPEAVAKKVDVNDLGKLRNYLTGSLQGYQEAQPMFKAMGIDGFDGKTQERFVKEVLDLNTKKIPVKSVGSFTKGDGGKFTGSTPKELAPLAKEAQKYKSAEEFINTIWGKKGFPKDLYELFNKEYKVNSNESAKNALTDFYNKVTKKNG